MNDWKNLYALVMVARCGTFTEASRRLGASQPTLGRHIRELEAEVGVPLVVHTIHGMSFNRTQPWLVQRGYAWLERWAARRSHAIVGVADAMLEQAMLPECFFRQEPPAPV